MKALAPARASEKTTVRNIFGVLVVLLMVRMVDRESPIVNQRPRGSNRLHGLASSGRSFGKTDTLRRKSRLSWERFQTRAEVYRSWRARY